MKIHRRKTRVRKITFLDVGPDSLGRRYFVIDWTDPAGTFRPEPDPRDGEPVGYRRAQYFYAVPPI